MNQLGDSLKVSYINVLYHDLGFSETPKKSKNRLTCEVWQVEYDRNITSVNSRIKPFAGYCLDQTGRLALSIRGIAIYRH